ncbi:MAG TPA: biotin/lipoyl-binding protein [Verrucomicrobiae bacterium]|jgi:putative peptide zinc metalloprotease protein
MADLRKTFSESWYRVANQKICLRPVVKARRQNFRGERWIVLENPFSNQYFRLRPAAYEFVSRLRPDRTVEEVWKQCLERFPDAAPSQEAVIQLLSQLYFSNLLQYDLAADSAQLFERYKKRKQREMGFRFLNIMFARFPLLDPDRFLVRTMPVVGKLIGPFGAALWFLVVGFGLVIAADNFSALRVQGQGLLATNNLVLLYIAMVIVKGFHEFGHAYFCRRYGGEVHVMGVMLMIFTPMPYVDATSAWSFRERWKRVLVGSAGMIVELFIAAIAAFFWAKTGPGVVHAVAYNIMFIASVSTIIFNINPLMRFDGYYILSDLLEIPNLNQRATMQLRYWAEKFLFGVKNIDSPAGTRREAGWLASFGITSWIYRTIIFAGVLLVVADRFLIIGIIMALVCLVSWAITPIVQFTKYLSSNPRLDRVRQRAIGVTAGIAAFVIILLAVVPFPYSFRAPGVVVAAQRTDIVNQSAGQVAELFVQSGSYVKKGQPLLRMSDPELNLELVATRAHLDQIEVQLRQAMDTNSADIQPLMSLHDSVAAEFKKYTEDSQNLTVRALHDGVWVAPDLNENVGRWLPRGTELGLLANPAVFDFEATVTEDDARDLFARKIYNASVRLWGNAETKLPVAAWRVVPGGQNNLPSAALGWAGGGEVPISADADQQSQGTKSAEPFFEVIGKLDAHSDVGLFDGRSGKISFKLQAEPLLPRWIRGLWQLLQKRYQI